LNTLSKFGTLIAVLCLASFVSVVSLVAEEKAPLLPGIATEKPKEGKFIEVDGVYMVPYTVKFPSSDVSFKMIPIPGGEYLMGSPAGEEGRDEKEGPQVKVTVPPFWMAEHEVSWAEYKEYMSLYVLFTEFHFRKQRIVNDDNKADAITSPSELYEPPFTYEHGEDPEQAAVTMTQFAAKQYSKWLSLMSGQQYRLPTEAEWEYACRAGTTTAYHFGDDPAKLSEYAWYAANAKDDVEEDQIGQHHVATKKPNPWGLYDMHGNVAEWVLDSQRENGYADLNGKGKLTALDTVQLSDEEWGRIVRGGSWESDPAGCRCAAKMASEDYWKDTDPNSPKSPWWLTDDPSRGVGFRLIRPLHELPREKIARFWEVDDDSTEFSLEDRIKVGKGRLGIVDPTLPKAIETFRENQ